MLAVLDRLRQRKIDNTELVYFYTRASILTNVAEQMRTMDLAYILWPFQTDTVDKRLSLGESSLDITFQIDSTNARKTLEFVRDSLMNRKQYNLPYSLGHVLNKSKKED